METLLPVPHVWSNVSVTMNILGTLLLITGFVAIKRKQVTAHKAAMIATLVCSALFLAAYLYGHAVHGSTHYPVHDWTYVLYLVILIPHSLLAVAILPFILRGLWLIGTRRPAEHARLMRQVWPVWLYVSLTGIVVYLMLYGLRGIP